MTDCGTACLLSLIKFYGGDSTILHLRKISGTSGTGTTLLGLYQAAGMVGFTAQGAEANGIQDLIEYGKPCILIVVIENRFSHYVIFYGFKNGKFIISDPAKGIIEMTETELDTIWTKKCLLLEPNDSFVKKKSMSNRKKGWLLSLVREDFGILGASIAISFVISILGMVMAIFSQKLVDDVIPSHDKTKLIIGIFLVLILLLANIAISAIRSKLLIIQSRDFNNRIIRFFFGKLLNLPKSFFDTRKTGDMIARLNDTRRIQSLISTLASETIINSLSMLVAVSLLFIYSWKVALLSMLCMPIYYWIISRYNNRIISQQQDVMGSYAMSESGFINTISGISDIKRFSRQSNFLNLNELLYSTFQDNVFNLGKTKIHIGIWAGFVGTVIQIGIIAICCIFVFEDSMTIGELMAIIGISGTLFPAVANLALVMLPINEAKVAFARMYEIVDAKEDDCVMKGSINDDAVYCLETRGLTFRFIGQRCTLENISLKFSIGTITCIVGESGCGKSTLCQVLERFYNPEDGDILLNGTSANDISIGKWRNLFSVVPQDTFLYNGTVLENICLGNIPKNIKEVVTFCEKYGFDKFFSELPAGLGTLVGEEGINLSGGQRQLIAFARALYKSSRVLILDEMTASMDRRTEKHICAIMESLRKDHIIIFITHRIETAKRIGDNIVVMENGHIATQGSHEQLMQSENFYSEYWKSL